jgi:hypothetical protein
MSLETNTRVRHSGIPARVLLTALTILPEMARWAGGGGDRLNGVS